MYNLKDNFEAYKVTAENAGELAEMTGSTSFVTDEEVEIDLPWKTVMGYSSAFDGDYIIKMRNEYFVLPGDVFEFMFENNDGWIKSEMVAEGPASPKDFS